MKRLVVYFSLIFGLSAPLFGADLVKNGRSTASIILSAEAGPAEKFAASELIDFVKEITGAELKTGIVSGLTPIEFVLVSNPMTAEQKKLLPGLQDTGFAVSASSKAVTIYGMRPRAFANAVYYLLKDYGGVRFFHPRTEPYIPSSKDFTIPDGTLIKNPVFRHPDIIANGVWTTSAMIKQLVRSGVNFCGTPNPKLKNDKDFQEQYDCSEKLGQADELAWGGHYLSILLVGPDRYSIKNTEELLKEHPEYFGLKNGKRVISHNPPLGDEPISQPCLSNPEVKRIMLANAIKYIDANFKDKNLILTLCNDDHQNWCECPNCCKLDNPKAGKDGKNSDRWWDFVNFMAENLLPRYPKMLLKVDAYQDYREVPSKTKMFKHDRLFVNLCPHGRCYIHSLRDPACEINKKYYEMLNSWWKTGLRTEVFEYFEVLPGNSPYLPVELAYASDAKLYSENNVSGVRCMMIGGRQHFIKHPYYETFYATNHWESLWKTAYILGYLNWHPDGDWQKALTEVQEKYYGKAAPQMIEFHKTIADTFRKNGTHACYGGGNEIFGRVYDSPGVAKKLTELLDSAMKEANDDKVVLARISKDAELFRKNFKEASFSDFSSGGNVYRMEKAEKIKIDGELNESEWIKAASTDELYTDRVEITVGEFESHKMVPQTVVKALYDNDNIYFGLECFKTSSGKTNDVRTFKGDFPWSSSHLEFLIMTPELAKDGKYRHICFTRNGIKYNSLAKNMGECELKDPVSFEYAVRDLPDRWIAEVKISAQKLGKITDGALWKINIGREAVGYNDKMISGAFSGKGGNYHTRSHFMIFAFGSDGPVLLNGSFEKLTDKKISRYSGTGWNFFSKEIPTDWTFVNNMKGPAEARANGASEGKTYLRIGELNKKIEGYPTIWQYLRIADSDMVKYTVQMDMRGNGNASCRVNVQGIRGNFGQKSFFVKSKDWKTYEYSFTLSEPGKKMFLMDFTGEYVDIDNVRITVEK